MHSKILTEFGFGFDESGDTCVEEYKVNKYKFRAECIADVMLFLKSSKPFSINFTLEFSNELPDVTCTIETTATLEDLGYIFDEIVDSHVMRETIKPELEYTGDREVTA
jgi:hypothetical protein